MSAFTEILILFVQLVFGTLMLIFALRIALPLSTTRFSNPICQFVYKFTNPVIGPLMRILPPYRKLSLAAVVVAWLILMAQIAVIALIIGFPIDPVRLLADGFVALLFYLLSMAFWLIVIYALMSFFSPAHGNPAVEVVYGITDPILRPFQRIPPHSWPVSLAPLYAGLAIRILMIFVAKLASALGAFALPLI
jgi:YggT family protein